MWRNRKAYIFSFYSCNILCIVQSPDFLQQLWLRIRILDLFQDKSSILFITLYNFTNPVTIGKFHNEVILILQFINVILFFIYKVI